MIDTQYERAGRKPFARLVSDKSAMATARAEYDIHPRIPPEPRVDRTWDNGSESSCHRLVDEALGMLTYFAPLQLPAEGRQGNRNERIRRQPPKGTGFDCRPCRRVRRIHHRLRHSPPFIGQIRVRIVDHVPTRYPDA